MTLFFTNNYISELISGNALGVQTFNRILFWCSVNNFTENVAKIHFMITHNRNGENINKTFRNYYINSYSNANLQVEL